jgi:hypothetical protein
MSNLTQSSAALTADGWAGQGLLGGGHFGPDHPLPGRRVKGALRRCAIIRLTPGSRRPRGGNTVYSGSSGSI